MGKKRPKATTRNTPAPITAHELEGYARQLVNDGRATTSILTGFSTPAPKPWAKPKPRPKAPAAAPVQAPDGPEVQYPHTPRMNHRDRRHAARAAVRVLTQDTAPAAESKQP